MQEASEREGRTDKHPVTPGPLLPTREQLGEMLLIMGRYAEALREYEAVQKTEPGRFRATYGAGRAAELGGDGEAARRHYAHLLEVAARAQRDLAEVEHARAFLSR
jgi:hypothetical protein